MFEVLANTQVVKVCDNIILFFFAISSNFLKSVQPKENWNVVRLRTCSSLVRNTKRSEKCFD